jgi:hypothetical protein
MTSVAAAVALALAMPLRLAPAETDPVEDAAPEGSEPEGSEPDGSEPEPGEPEGSEPEVDEGEPEAVDETDEPEAQGEPEAHADPPPVPTVPDEPLPDTDPGDEYEEEVLDDEEPLVDDYDPLRDSPEAIEARRMITGGIILISTGTVLAVGSLAIGLTDPCTRPAGNSCNGPARNRAAVTMAVPAVAIFVAGAALLGVGIRNRNRLRASVAFTPRAGALLLSGRF